MNTELEIDPVVSKKRGWLVLLFRVGRFCILAYVAVLVFLVFAETSLVFPGSPYPRGNWEPTEFAFEEVNFSSDDGTQLVGWYLPKENSAETVLLCHGNAENAAQASAYIGCHLRDALNASVFVYDYRGYGKSDGKPSETGILADSKSALKWLNERTGTTPDDVIIVGHSIGGGPACYLAGEFGAKALILQRTFSSLVAAAQHQYPFVPVSFLMKNRFPSDERIKKYNGPLFQSHGTDDSIVKYELGRKLFDCCPSHHKQFFEIKGKGHYDPLPISYWQELMTFVQSVSH